jgi:hypothetical protein
LQWLNRGLHAAAYTCNDDMFSLYLNGGRISRVRVR